MPCAKEGAVKPAEVSGPQQRLLEVACKPFARVRSTIACPRMTSWPLRHNFASTQKEDFIEVVDPANNEVEIGKLPGSLQVVDTFAD